MFRYRRFTIVREVVLWIAAVIFLLPFYFLIVMALKPDSEVFSTSPAALPESPTLENFVTVLTAEGQTNVLLGVWNSLMITTGAVLIVVILSSTAAYIISRSTRRMGRAAYYLFLVALVLPAQLGSVALYIGARSIGLTGSAWGIIVIYAGAILPLATFLYANFFRTLGTEYEEAATIDGASRAQIFFRIVLPLMAPATGTVAIFAGMFVWNDFMLALIFLGGSEHQTLTVTMYYYVGSLVSQWNQIFSIVIISMVPLIILFAVAQKQLMRGFAGGLKG